MIYRQNRKWLAWVEAAVIYGAAAFWLITYDVPWLLWSPNPFLFVVLYFALRYGNRVGIAAAAGASALHLASFLQENGDWYGLFDRWENSKWFISYWGIALFVGHVASDLRFRYAVLADEQEETKEHLAKVEESYGDLMKVKTALENKVVGAQESLFTLYKIARALDSDNSEIIFTDAVRLFKDLIKAASIVIYRMSPSGDILRRKVYFGGEITYPATVFLDRPSVYARVCSERTIQLRMENEPADSPMLAGPLLDEEGKVIAVIGLNGLDFAAMNRHTVDLFRLILVWMGESCVKAFRHEQLGHGDRYFPGTHVMRPEAFYAKLNEETLRAEDFDQEFLLLQIPVDFGAMEEIAAVREVDHLMKQTLRSGDEMAYDAFRRELLYLLPATSPELASRIEERIRSRFSEGGLAP